MADFCGVTGMELLVAWHIREIIKRTSDLMCIHPASDEDVTTTFRTWNQTSAAATSALRDPDINTQWITSEHVVAASHLPTSHPIRELLAEACVEGFLQTEEPKFGQESRDIPNFAVDLLAAVKRDRKSV